MDLLDDVKLSLGITHRKKDAEIQETIDAALLDMKAAGAGAAVNEIDANALARQAVKLYARGFYNYQGKSADWLERYESTKNLLALANKGDGRL